MYVPSRTFGFRGWTLFYKAGASNFKAGSEVTYDCGCLLDRKMSPKWHFIFMKSISGGRSHMILLLSKKLGILIIANVTKLDFSGILFYYKSPSV